MACDVCGAICMLVACLLVCMVQVLILSLFVCVA